jgi:hypothetical protein
VLNLLHPPNARTSTHQGGLISIPHHITPHQHNQLTGAPVYYLGGQTGIRDWSFNTYCSPAGPCIFLSRGFHMIICHDNVFIIIVDCSTVDLYACPQAAERVHGTWWRPARPSQHRISIWPLSALEIDGALAVVDTRRRIPRFVVVVVHELVKSVVPIRCHVEFGVDHLFREC